MQANIHLQDAEKLTTATDLVLTTLCADIAIGPNLMFAARLGAKFKGFPALAKYVGKLKV